MAVGVISSSFYQVSREVTLATGESTNIGRYTLTYQRLTDETVGSARTVSAHLLLSVDGTPVRMVEPGKVFYSNFNDQPATRVAIETERLEDLYLVLTGWGDDSTISMVAIINPMVPLIWFGGLVLLVGAIVSLWPEPKALVRRAPVPTRVTAAPPIGITPAPPAPTQGIG